MKRKEQIIDMILAGVLFALAAVIFVAGATWAETMNKKPLVVCALALLGAFAIAIYLNTRRKP